MKLTFIFSHALRGEEEEEKRKRKRFCFGGDGGREKMGFYTAWREFLGGAQKTTDFPPFPPLISTGLLSTCPHRSDFSLFVPIHQLHTPFPLSQVFFFFFIFEQAKKRTRRSRKIRAAFLFALFTFLSENRPLFSIFFLCVVSPAQVVRAAPSFLPVSLAQNYDFEELARESWENPLFHEQGGGMGARWMRWWFFISGERPRER